MGVELHGIGVFRGPSGRRDGKWPTLGGKMSETMAYIREERVIEEQKLWRAVIANTVEDWIYGPLHRQREAEHFLFEDQEDFHIVCFSAGMNPRYFRDRLKRIRSGEGAEALARAS
jgi:hypothetical protein